MYDGADSRNKASSTSTKIPKVFHGFQSLPTFSIVDDTESLQRRDRDEELLETWTHRDKAVLGSAPTSYRHPVLWVDAVQVRSPPPLAANALLSLGVRPVFLQ